MNKHYQYYRKIMISKKRTNCTIGDVPKSISNCFAEVIQNKRSPINFTAGTIKFHFANRLYQLYLALMLIKNK